MPCDHRVASPSPDIATWPGYAIQWPPINVNQCTCWGAVQSSHGRHRLVAAMGRIPRKRGRAFDERRLSSQPRCPRCSARSRRASRTRHSVHVRPEPQRAHTSSQNHRHSTRMHTSDTKRRPLPSGHGCTRTDSIRRPNRRIHPHACAPIRTSSRNY